MMASSFAGSLLSRRSCAAPFGSARPAARTAVIECAQKKGGGSTRNGRDSIGKRRGIKVYGGQPVKAGGIIVRQVGSTWHPGDNTMLGSDYTLFSTVEGIVLYDKKKERPVVHVYPLEHAKSQAAILKTHTTKPADGETSRKQRRLAAFHLKPRRSAGAAAAREQRRSHPVSMKVLEAAVAAAN